MPPPRADADRPPPMTAFADRRRTGAALLLAAATLFSWSMAASAQEPYTIDQLMHTLAQVKSGEATFTEKRSVTMLERTLESSGRLSFEAPDTFVRETLKPTRERIAIVGNMVTMSQGSRKRTVPLDSVPEAAVIMEAIRGTLTGNREALDRYFVATVSGTAQRWSLDLVPRDALLRERVGTLRLSGQQALVREVVVALSDGDRSVMTIAPLAPTAPAPPASGASAPG